MDEKRSEVFKFLTPWDQKDHFFLSLSSRLPINAHKKVNIMAHMAIPKKVMGLFAQSSDINTMDKENKPKKIAQANNISIMFILFFIIIFSHISFLFIYVRDFLKIGLFLLFFQIFFQFFFPFRNEGEFHDDNLSFLISSNVSRITSVTKSGRSHVSFIL